MAAKTKGDIIRFNEPKMTEKKEEKEAIPKKGLQNSMGSGYKKKKTRLKERERRKNFSVHSSVLFVFVRMCGYICFCCSKYALRVSPAETRLTVYRRLRV